MLGVGLFSREHHEVNIGELRCTSLWNKTSRGRVLGKFLNYFGELTTISTSQLLSDCTAPLSTVDREKNTTN